jgi:hypothetical protein
MSYTIHTEKEKSIMIHPVKPCYQQSWNCILRNYEKVPISLPVIADDGLLAVFAPAGSRIRDGKAVRMILLKFRSI